MASRNVALQDTVPDPGLRFSQPRRGGITLNDPLGVEAGAQVRPAERLGPRQRADRVTDGAGLMHLVRHSAEAERQRGGSGPWKRSANDGENQSRVNLPGKSPEQGAVTG
jgi:hypothetical protein